ncbi:Ran-binding proteins 9/10-like protein [Phytophthora ramorum]|uniref:B30.2/SPRY domain-containing protein n=1 Tax=Phytophthora ramorum TaxID=164328 RepID=H3H1A4_PHYRM|nr:Ran-binding proteins 9/10-like protein [Phytophthora ramorum]
MAPIHALDDELVAQLLSFAAPRDVEAFTCASKFTARSVLPRFPVWKALFCHRWETLNFRLPGACDGSVPLVVSEQLRKLFPESVSESRLYQLLAHAITPLPAYADIQQTRHYRGSLALEQNVVSLHAQPIKPTEVVDFGFDGDILGDDRCVRSNAPFPTTFHVAVFKRRNPQTNALEYHVGVVSSGYFEISVTKRVKPSARRVHGEDVTSIGLVTSRFPLVDRQPGWDFRSYGYHGDDGQMFHSNRGRQFGPAFGTSDTIGCGVRRSVRDGRSFVMFTNNGELIGNEGSAMECVHEQWYPAVGLDSSDAIHVNFGQEPFAYDGVVDEMLQECAGNVDIVQRQLQWFAIYDSDGASASSGSVKSAGSFSASPVDESDGYDEYGLVEDYDGTEWRRYAASDANSDTEVWWSEGEWSDEPIFD